MQRIIACPTIKVCRLIQFVIAIGQLRVITVDVSIEGIVAIFSEEFDVA